MMFNNDDNKGGWGSGGQAAGESGRLMLTGAGESWLMAIFSSDEVFNVIR